MTGKPPAGTPVALAFEWITGRVAAPHGAELVLLVAEAKQRFRLSAIEVEWLTWSFEPSTLSLASKEPEPGPS